MSAHQYMTQAIDADLPRIIRKDLTALTELVAKYRGFEAHLRERDLDDAAEQISDVTTPLSAARQVLEHVMPSLMATTAPSPMGPGAGDAPRENPPSFGEKPPVAEESPGAPVLDNGGKATLLTSILGQAGFVSSSAIAKRAIHAGAVAVNGSAVSNVAALLEPGTYTIRCGDIEASVEVT